MLIEQSLHKVITKQKASPLTTSAAIEHMSVKTCQCLSANI